MNQVSRRTLIGCTAAALANGRACPTNAGNAGAADTTAADGTAAVKDWWPREFKTLVTLGESTTAGGWASSRQRCWANQLARLINEFQRVPVQLVNVGIGANVISTRSPSYDHSGKPAALERLDAHVVRHQPDLLVVSYGLNDARGGTPKTLFERELRRLVEEVRGKIQPLIVLLGPYFMTGFDKYGPHWNQASLEVFQQFNGVIAEVAKQERCLFVDLLGAYGGAEWLVHHDAVHANDLGHRLVANKIFEILASHCSGLARETQVLEQQIPPWRDESVLRQAGQK